VIGGSAGGLVVGGAVTKRPDLFRSAVLRVPVVNLLRAELDKVGPGNIPEFGTVAVEEDFRSMFASDPYHRIRHGIIHPAILLTTGRNDPRVPTWQPAKFAARLQAASNRRPALLRVEGEAGHGFWSTQTQREEEFADAYAFLLWQAAIPIQ
jgi:prolyl oligopeptidase